jgi:hypothetical protein
MALSTGEVIICFIVNVYHADAVACNDFYCTKVFQKRSKRCSTFL